MRKYIIGGIVGFALAFSVSAHANEIISLVGKEIQGEFPVSINGQKLENNAAVVDGTSYLPVRAIGEALNMDVSFDADLGIELKPKAVSNQVEQQQPSQVQEKVIEVKYHAQTNYKDMEATQLNSGDYGLIEIEGDQYVSASSLSGLYQMTWKMPVLEVVAKDGQTFNITTTKNHIIGTEAFEHQGSVYVKLSALGLKATVSGDTIIIEKQ